MSKSVFNNATLGTDLHERMATGFSEVADVLLNHCGPYATTAIIGGAGRSVDVLDTFTKDGISIARALLSDKDPIARFACRISRFLGTTTDKHCHDGTTTAMALFALLVKRYFICKPQFHAEATTPPAVTDRIVNTEMRKFIKSVQDIMSAMIVTKEDLCDLWKDDHDITPADVTKAMAYQTALIASKGDVALASAIATVIDSTPVDMFGLFVKTLAKNEQAEPIEIIEQPYQFEIECTLGADAMNIDMNQRYRADRAVIFGATKALSQGSWEEEILYHLLGQDARSMTEQAKYGLDGWWDNHDGRHLIILSPQANSMRLMDRIRTFNDVHPNNRVVIADLQLDSSAIIPMTTCLYAMRGLQLPEFMDEEETYKAFIDVGPVTYSTRSLKIEGIYEKTGDALHPMYLNPDLSVHYTNARTTLEKLLSDHVKDPLLTGMNALVANKCIYYYRFMTCQKIVDVSLGGLLHGNRELQSVYEDAMGSAISATRHGVICDVFFTIHNIARAMSSRTTSVHDIWRRALEELLSAVHQKPFSDLDSFSLSVSGRMASFMVDVEKHDSVVRDLSDHDVAKDFLDTTSTKPAALIQPYMGVREQLRRIGDILPGVMNTSLFIDMGHVDDDHLNRNA